MILNRDFESNVIEITSDLAEHCRNHVTRCIVHLIQRAGLSILERNGGRRNAWRRFVDAAVPALRLISMRNLSREEFVPSGRTR